jgi:hypothetical protein
MAKKSETQKAVEEALGIQKGDGWLKSIIKECLGVEDARDAASKTLGTDKKGKGK